VRVFIAVRLPDATAEAAFRILPDALPALRRVRPDLFHLTLAFLGEVLDTALEAVSAACAVAAGEIEPFTVSLDRVGSFPPRRGDAAVWAGVAEGAETLRRLAGAVRAELERAEIRFDPKPFVAHVTLARIRGEADIAERRAVAAALTRIPPPDLRFRAERIEVVQSVLSSKGPRYSSLRAVSLEGKRVEHPGRGRRDRARDA
jgi:2'-5' RNA ligase